jgi:serine/threonine protein kinase
MTEFEEPLSPGAGAVAKDEVDRIWSGGLASLDLGLTTPKVLIEQPFGQQHHDGRLRRKLSICSPKTDVRIEDHYKVDSQIGEGGFAVVRSGVHITTNSPCCLKVIEKKGAGRRYRDFVVEAGGYEMMLSMSKKPHPCVVKYLDFMESEDRYYVVMEKLYGCELTIALTDQTAPRWTEKRCASVMHDLLSALDHIHNVVGVMHRDVKLENLRFRGRTSGPKAGRKVDGAVVLVDFGLCRFVDQDWDGRRDGTPLYTAPEVISEWRAPRRTDGYFTPAVDCWAAGLVLFILLTGGVPFDEDEVEAGQGGQLAAASIDTVEAQRTADGLSTPSLLRGLLEADPAKRLTASEALGDSWLQLAEDVNTLKAPKTYDYAVQMSKLSSKLVEKTRVPTLKQEDSDSNDGAAVKEENRYDKLVESEGSTDDSDGRSSRLYS